MRSKVLAVIIAVTALASILVAIIFYLRSADMVEENYRKNLHARLTQMGESFDDSLREIYQLAVQEACDDALTERVPCCGGKDADEAVNEISAILRAYANRSSDLDSVYLVISEQEMIITSREYPIYKMNVSAERLNSIYFAGQEPLAPVFLRDPLNEEEYILSYVSPVVNEKGKTLAYIMNNMSETAFYYKYLDGFARDAERAAILDRDGNMVLETKLPLNGKGEVITTEYRAGFTGYRFFAEAERREVLTDLENIRYFLLLILAASFLAVTGLSAVITREMYRPLQALTETMEAVSGGELEQRVAVTTKDEIGMLSKEFNQMLDRIQDLIRQLIQKETQKKNAELEALQYQITPHFMYNTLNSIRCAALLKGEQEIGELIEEFTELLQASVSRRGTFVTVAEEIHFVQNYMNLQSMRYEEKIQVEYRIQEESTGCYVPRLILQPLVENAILHGLDLKNGRDRIVIGSEVAGGVLSLWVLDNGGKLKERRIESILAEDRKKTRGLSGIGVTNVRERLKLYYGRAGGLTYEGGEDWTKACIRLPAYREQDRYAL